MNNVLSALLLFIVAATASAQNSFLEAREAAAKVISAELRGGSCPLAVPTTAERERVRSALAGVTVAGLTDQAGLDPLNLAVLADDLPSLRRLEQLGYSLKEPGSLLLGASQHDSQVVLNHLLATGADPNWSDSHGATPLMVAASSGRVEAAKALIAAGAKPNLKNRNGRTALHYALLCPS